MKARPAQAGFALIAALFLLVVLAALGVFAVRMNMTQRHASDLELQELRAQAAVSAALSTRPHAFSFPASTTAATSRISPSEGSR